MENNKRCYIFFPSSFFGSKKNGRRSGRRVSQYSRFDNRIFAIFRFFVWLAVWLCPCFFRSALAEFDQSDSDRLKWIQESVNDIDAATGDILNFMTWSVVDDIHKLNEISQGLGYYGTSATGSLKGDMTKILNYMGYGSGTSLASQLTSLVNQTNQIKTNLGGDNYNTIADRLDDLINYLENSSSTPTDYATETTLSAFKSKYEEVANQFLTSWGFVGGSGGTLKDYLVSVFGDKPSNTITYYLYDVFENPSITSPFPNNNKYWYDLTRYETSMTVNSPFEAIIYQLFYGQYNKEYYFRANLMNMQKQAWNDWQAHTNTVAHLDMIVSSLNSTPDIYVNDTDDIGTVTDDKLNITFDKSTGDSPESIELNPAFTNDVAELTAPAESLTNKVAKLITYSKLSNRYKTPNVDETNYRDYEIIQDIPDYDLQYGTRPQMVFKFTSTARNLFRGFLPREKMTTLRNIFSKLWAFLAIYCNFLIFKIFGKMGGNE